MREDLYLYWYKVPVVLWNGDTMIKAYSLDVLARRRGHAQKIACGVVEDEAIVGSPFGGWAEEKMYQERSGTCVEAAQALAHDFYRDKESGELPA